MDDARAVLDLTEHREGADSEEEAAMGIDVPRHGRGTLLGPPGARGARGPSSGAVGASPGLGAGPLPRVLGGVAESITLPREPASASRARLVVRVLCQQVGLSGGVVHEAALLTGEVVSNAVRHATGTPHLSVVVSPAGVYVEVEDDSMTLPVLATAQPSSSGGRGTAVLEAWADAWGACSQGTGKVVWFALRAS